MRKNAAGCKLDDTFLRMTTFLDKQMLFGAEKRDDKNNFVKKTRARIA